MQSSGGPHRHPSGRLHAERIARGQRTRERLYRAARDERCVVAWGVEAQDPERLGGGLSAQEAFGSCRRVGHVRVDGRSVAPSFIHEPDKRPHHSWRFAQARTHRRVVDGEQRDQLGGEGALLRRQADVDAVRIKRVA